MIGKHPSSTPGHYYNYLHSIYIVIASLCGRFKVLVRPKVNQLKALDSPRGDGLPLGKPVIASSLTGADDGKWIRTGALSSKHMHSFRWHRLVRRSQDRGPGNGKEGSVH